MKEYYHRYSQRYFKQTFSVDPSEFLEPLARRLANGASVLDVGCGSGRDLLWMKQRGFQPIGFEYSPDLANLAEKASGCEVITGDFETFDFSRLSFDAVLMVAALVHVPHEKLFSVISGISKALRPGGWVLLSLKEGTGEVSDRKGRSFYLWQVRELATGLSVLDFEVVETAVRPSALGTGEKLISLLLRSKISSAGRQKDATGL